MDQVHRQPEITQKKHLAPTLALLRMLQGEWVARSIHVATNLGLADLLKDGPRSVQELAQATSAHAPSLYRLLRALVSVGVFVEIEPNVFAQTELSGALRSDRPGSLFFLAQLYGREWQWRIWEHLEYSIRTGKSATEHLYGENLWGYLTAHPADAEIYNQALTGASEVINAALARAYDFSALGTLVDIGGGYGSLLRTILAAYPELKGVLFDQPSVIEPARERIDPALQDRMQLVAGDFFIAVPEGGDAYLMKQILHDWSDEDGIRILETCRRVMKPGSKLLVADAVIQPGGGEETSLSKYIDLLTLVIHAGRERTADEFARLFAATGFKLTRIVPTGTPISIVEGVAV